MYLILTEQTYNQRITWLYWTPKGAFEPIGKYKKKKNQIKAAEIYQQQV